MTDDEPDLDALKAQTSPGTRAGMAAGKPSDEFVDDVKGSIKERQEKGASRSVAVWDANIAGLLDALDDHPERLEAAVDELADGLDREVDGDDHDKSEVLRLLILAGLRNGVPDLEDEWREAVGELAKEQL